MRVEVGGFAEIPVSSRLFHRIQNKNGSGNPVSDGRVDESLYDLFLVKKPLLSS